MIKLTQTSRKILRAVYRGAGIAVAALTLGACPPPWVHISYPEYGPGPDYPIDEVFIHGQVVSKTGKPVKGIGIWIKDVTVYNAILTGNNGNFSFWLPKQDNHTIIFTDIDGEENGLFEQRTINLTWKEVQALEFPLIIELEEITVETDA